MIGLRGGAGGLPNGVGVGLGVGLPRMPCHGLWGEACLLFSIGYSSLSPMERVPDLALA